LPVTIFAVAMILFPYYSKIYFSKTKKEIMFVEKSKIQSFEYEISGMTCEGCTEKIKLEVNELKEVLKPEASCQNANADSLAEITKAINSTGYKVIQTKLK
jgi:mercuric ion transport protein